MNETEALRKALHRAWSLGQTYCQQADSDSYKQNAKSDETRAKFLALVEETIAATPIASEHPSPSEPEALRQALAELLSATERVSVGDYNEEAHDIAVSRARAALALPVSEPVQWHSVATDGMPPCDGETVYLGENENGHLGTFDWVNPDGCCLQGLGDAKTAQFSCLAWWRVADRPSASPGSQEAEPQPTEMSPEFTDTSRAALLWVLWHHQGGFSPVGQPIRFALGMGEHERLNEHQITIAKRWAALTKSRTEDFHRLYPATSQEAASPSQREAGQASMRDHLTDERIDQIADFVARGMEDGIQGFMKTWGWQQFARALLECVEAPSQATTPSEAAQPKGDEA